MKTTITTINPKLAAEMLQTSKAAGGLNRDTKAKLNRLIQQFRAGRWILNGEPIIIGASGRILDGHHRLTACCMANVSFDTVLVTEATEAALDTIDTGSSRSISDTLHLAGHAGKKSMLSALGKGKKFVDSIRISCNVDPKIATRGDARRLRQVFWNLLINTCQAMPNGGEMTISANLFLHSEDDSTWCEIIIADTGQGISPEHLAKIFDPFFTTKIGGTGLGLAIAYRIIDDHGGTIVVEAKEGRGTKFRILIPMIEDPSHPESVKARIRHRIVS